MLSINSIINKIVIYLINSEFFEDKLREIIVDEYKKSSLSTYRLWGDESRLTVKDNVHLNNAIINTVSGNVHIGDNSFLGHSVSLLTGTHVISKTGISRQSSVPSNGRDIIIGSGVWIASNVTVIGPCTIGDNSVISANSVVTGTIAEDTIYGNEVKYVSRDINFG